MTKLNRIKEVLKSLLVEFGTVATDKGTIVWDEDEELKEGMSVHTVDEEGNDVALEDGVYTTEDKKLITIADGKVVSIEDVDAEVSSEPAAEEPVENAEDEPSNEEPSTEDEPATDERDERIAELEARIAELEAENAELKAENDKLKEESAAPSAEEAFEKLDVEDNTKVGKMSKRGYKFN